MKQWKLIARIYDQKGYCITEISRYKDGLPVVKGSFTAISGLLMEIRKISPAYGRQIKRDRKSEILAYARELLKEGYLTKEARKYYRQVVRGEIPPPKRVRDMMNTMLPPH